MRFSWKKNIGGKKIFLNKNNNDLIEELKKKGIINKNPTISVKNPGIISSKAAKANAAPDIISYIGISFLIIC